MKVGYYPGCSLEATAKDYDESIRGVMDILKITLVELEDWNCCGASAGHSLDHRISLNLAARNLILAAGGPMPLVVPCALCFNRLKSAQAELAGGDQLLTPAIRRMKGDHQSVEVMELNAFLTSDEMILRMASLAKNSLNGLKPVCYYGCQGQRPPAVTQNPAPENPMGLDLLLEALGADVRDWPAKTDCCGASHAIARPDIIFTLVAGIFNHALKAGANCIVTGCQMCQANLDLYQERIAAQMGREVYLPVFYFTELAGLAMGHENTPLWLRRHMVSPVPLLAEQGLTGEVWQSL